jgi:hypothetical protein
MPRTSLIYFIFIMDSVENIPDVEEELDTLSE